jgi:hypothetical protein
VYCSYASIIPGFSLAMLGGTSFHIDAGWSPSASAVFAFLVLQINLSWIGFRSFVLLAMQIGFLGMRIMRFIICVSDGGLLC